ncbi:MAG: GNAT family N-acetyltransferase [Candidatus Fermentibacteraceae bacterium]
MSVVIELIEKSENLSAFIDLSELAKFLHESLKPYDDPICEITSGIEQALSPDIDAGGFVALALDGRSPVGALVMLDTHMRGFVPPNLVLYVAVSPLRRGEGIGAALLSRSIERCGGPVKLHVEYDNPAKRLYERLGFRTRYAEMRLE